MKVLIVEDQALIALAYADMVESAGHTVIGICASLPQAMELTRDQAPDIALVDLRLGNKQCGAKVDAYLNEAFGTTSLYITANREFAFTYRTRAIGFAEKPLTPDNVLRLVRYLAAHHQGQRPPVPPFIHLFELHGTAPRPPAARAEGTRVVQV